MTVTDPTTLTLAPLTTPDDLRTYLQVDDTDLTDAAADMLIANASADIRDYCGWPVTSCTRTVQAIPIGGQDWYLPTKFLTSVAALRVGRDPGDGSNAVDPSRYQWTASGILMIAEGFVFPASRFETFSAPFNDPYFAFNGWLLPLLEADIVDGYANVPSTLAGACQEVAALARSNPDGIQSMTVGMTSQRFGSKSVASGYNLSPEAQAAIDSYRLKELP